MRKCVKVFCLINVDKPTSVLENKLYVQCHEIKETFHSELCISAGCRYSRWILNDNYSIFYIHSCEISLSFRFVRSVVIVMWLLVFMKMLVLKIQCLLKIHFTRTLVMVLLHIHIMFYYYLILSNSVTDNSRSLLFLWNSSRIFICLFRNSFC